MIRPYEQHDEEALLDVWDKASVIAHSFLPETFFAEERRLITEVYLPQSETWVAEMDGRLVGFMSLVGQELGGLFVDPDVQRRGIGRSLVAKAQEQQSNLELGVFEENADARHFYARCGFVEVGTTVEEASGHVEVRMRWAPFDPSTV